MSDFLTRARARARDLESSESRLVQSAVTGLFTVVVSPRRLRGPRLTTIHALSGLAGVAVGAVAVGESVSPAKRAAAGATVGALLAGASVLGMEADSRVEGWLRGKGVRHPRLWFGLVAAVFTWLTSAPRQQDEAELDAEAEGGADPDHR